jgi:porin
LSAKRESESYRNRIDTPIVKASTWWSPIASTEDMICCGGAAKSHQIPRSCEVPRVFTPNSAHPGCLGINGALACAYSTFGAGLIWMPIPPGPGGGIVVSSSVVNTTDSSTTTGFEDFDKGSSWTTEADFQYRLGSLPGGMNIGALYSFNQNFARLNTTNRLVLQPGQSLAIPTKQSSWAVYWSAWQYLFVEPPGNRPPEQFNGVPKQQGIGLFARFGVADPETNPVGWALSGGFGGRGLIPSRENDCFGVGYYYNSIQTLRLSGLLGINDSAQGFECFYNVAITPAARLTLDLQVVDSPLKRLQTATVLGMRASLEF